MNAIPEHAVLQPEVAEPPTDELPKPPVNPHLTAELSENYNAIQNDLKKADDLAGDIAEQLAGKAKEVRHLKFLFEQTKAHLGHLQDGIVALRAERHKLANEAQKSRALEFILKGVTEERNRLKHELEGVLAGLAAQNAEKSLHFDDRDRRIAEMTAEVVNLRREVEELRAKVPKPAPAVPHRPCPLKTAAAASVHDDPETDGAHGLHYI